MESVHLDLLKNLVVHIIYTLLIALYSFAKNFIERKSPFWKLIALGLITIFFAAVNIFSFYKFPNYFIIIFLVSFGLFCIVIIKELSALWLLGIIGADNKISKGIDYTRALNMCKDSLSFLGIGASKLTEARETFRAAITRCHKDGKPIRFLLCPPDHAKLVEIARRAERPETEYQATVKMSLGELRDLKEKKQMNIEVRFYEELPLFRLMFINDTICLASHYILGEGTGSQLPQLHIIKRPLGKRDKDSLYYPLSQYFEKLWEESEPWDFTKYL